MRFEEFERTAVRCFESIPVAFRGGIDQLVIERGKHAHPQLPDYLTLGECVHRDWQPEGTPLFSSIHLYYGSFAEIARKDPGFDVAAEIDETIRHELRHHLEDRADIPALADEDEAGEMNERRRAGLPFRPDFYRLGVKLDDRQYEVEGDVFVEVELRKRQHQQLDGAPLRVRFGEEVLSVPLPPLEAASTIVPIEGGWEDDDGAGGDLFVVVLLR